MPSLSRHFIGLSLDHRPAEAKKPSKREELRELGDSYDRLSREARDLLESGKTLVQESGQPDVVKQDLISDYDTQLEQLEESDRRARRARTIAEEQHKLWLLRNYGLKEKIDALRDLTNNIIEQSNATRAKTKRAIQGNGFIVYPSQRTIEMGLGNGRVDSLQKVNSTERESYIATSPQSKAFSPMGVVYQGNYILYYDRKYHATRVAVKTVTVNSHHPGFADIDQVKRRIAREHEHWRTLSQQDHPNILPFFGDFQRPRANDEDEETNTSDEMIYLVSPWASGGDAKHFLEQGDNRTLHALKLVGDVVLGLSFLHGETGYLTTGEKKRIWHGDLHPRNILIHEPQGLGKPLAWVADFGLSASEEATTFVTHNDYRAPELRDYDPEYRPVDQLTPDEKAAYKEERQIRASKMEKADVYSFGWTILYMLTGNHAPRSIKEEYRQRGISYILSEVQVSSGLRSLIGRCCHPDPSTRPTMAEVREECKRENLVPLEEEANREAILRD